MGRPVRTCSGPSSSMMAVQKSGNASTLDIIARVKEALARALPGLPPELNVRQLADQSLFVRASIDGVVTAVAARPNVVEEIAERRRADLAPSLDDAVDLSAAPPPRPVAERLAAPGLHLIAEIKRASPSAGRIAGGGEDIVARARAYEAGGAAAISVLCEPHWFGGSVDDLRAVRAAVAIPVLAKEFVVDERQLPVLRAAGADLVLLLAVLHPAKRLARLVERAFGTRLFARATGQRGGRRRSKAKAAATS